MTKREIKFRAYEKRIKQVRSIISWNFKSNGFYVTPDFLGDCCFWFKDHCEVMQYTGIKDKKGNKIFEGDIIVSPYEELEIGYQGNNIGYVIFEQGNFLCRYCDNEEYLSDIEIQLIGNIYENPELLKEQIK